MSATYKMLVETLGLEIANRLCAAFGGEKIYVPAVLRPANRLAAELMPDDLKKICDAFGGERLDIPQGPSQRRAQALSALQSGMAAKEVARRFGYTIRTVQRLKKQLSTAASPSSRPINPLQR